MARVLIIGYGNPLRQDDGAGPAVAEKLSQRLRGEDVEIKIDHQLLPEMAQSISAAELVIFIDAAVDLPPGEISVNTLMEDDEIEPTLGHAVGLQQLLAMAHKLYGKAPRAIVVRIGGEQWGLGFALSSTVKKSVGRAAQRVMAIVNAPLPHRFTDARAN